MDGAERYVVTNLFDGNEVARGTREEAAVFYLETQHDDVAVLLVEKAAEGTAGTTAGETTAPPESASTGTKGATAPSGSTTDAGGTAPAGADVQEPPSGNGTGTAIAVCIGILAAALLSTGGVAAVVLNRRRSSRSRQETNTTGEDIRDDGNV